MASKRRLRRKQCEGKRRYETAAEATAGIRALHKAKGYQGFLNVYRCAFCKGYHFGHNGWNWRVSA